MKSVKIIICLFCFSTNAFMAERLSRNHISSSYESYGASKFRHQEIYKIFIPITTNKYMKSDDDNISSQQEINHMRLRAKDPLQPKRISRRRIYFHRPLRILDSGGNFQRNNMKLMISTGLTFDDGDQLLVSAQKPLGLVLEERQISDNNINFNGIPCVDEEGAGHGCVVVQVLENSVSQRAGVKVGDVLVAVQNVDVGCATFEEVIRRLSEAPKVVNLRFWRKERNK